MLFSLQSGTNSSYSLGAYGNVLHDHTFWVTLRLSVELALETIAISLVLLVPTAYWVHLKLPRLRPYVEFMTILPFVVPPIILVVGLLKFYNGTVHAPHWYLGEAVPVPRLRLRDPRVPVRLSLARRRVSRHRHPHAHRGVAEPRRELADDDVARDRPEHPDGRARRRVPDSRDRHGRVHDREPRGVLHVPDVHRPDQPGEGLRGGGALAGQLRDHLGGDARAAHRRAWIARGRTQLAGGR